MSAPDPRALLAHPGAAPNVPQLRPVASFAREKLPPGSLDSICARAGISADALLKGNAAWVSHEQFDSVLTSVRERVETDKELLRACAYRIEDGSSIRWADRPRWLTSVVGAGVGVGLTALIAAAHQLAPATSFAFPLAGAIAGYAFELRRAGAARLKMREEPTEWVHYVGRAPRSVDRERG